MESKASSPKVFFGYPSSPPSLRATVSRAADLITATGTAESVTWEQLRVGGHFIIGEITRTIDESALACFDITQVNQNVMFELGFAVGDGRRIWPLLDSSYKDAKRTWDEIRLLSTVGYAEYENSEEIRAAFLAQQPHLTRDALLDEIELEPSAASSLLFIPTIHKTDADRALTRRIYREESRGFRVINADPGEASLYPFAWYAQQIYSSDAVVVHLASEARRGSAIHNARCALLAGVAHGMGWPLVMLAESNYYSPIDYRDLLYVYATAKDCESHADGWLKEFSIPDEEQRRRQRRAKQLKLATELKNLRLGEDVAEYEADHLANYFIETESYHQVIERATTLFVGRKGTGKTANLLRASSELGSDKRNLVVVIKPQSYELEAVMSFLTRYLDRDERSFAVDALWQYLLVTEIARAAAEQLADRPPQTLGPEERGLLDLMASSDDDLTQEFAIRLERAAGRLAEIEGVARTAELRSRFGQVLYETEVRALRRRLGEVLAGHERVAVMIDNLDKAWESTSAIPQLAHLILGLLSAAGQVARNFERTDHWRKAVRLTLAIFLRSDIFYFLKRVAREPDKIPYSRLFWSDPRLLLRLVEERYLASKPEDTDPDELWNRFFPETVRGKPVKDYLTETVLPRPRDILHLCNAAIAAAINARHERITEEDILAAERAYSQFALEALRVENGISAVEFEQVLYEFMGVGVTMTLDEARGSIASAGVASGRVEDVLAHLRALTFLGTEVKDGTFSFAEDPDDVNRANALANALSKRTGREPRLQIHPAFRSYLEASDT